MNLNGGGGMAAGYNSNPNIVSREVRQEYADSFERDLAVEVMNNPKTYRACLKEMSFALHRHDEATSALESGRVAQCLCWLLAEVEKLRAQVKELESKCQAQ